MVDCNNVIAMDMNMLIMFRCPLFENEGATCVFARPKQGEQGDELQCRDKACEIRLPEGEGK